MSEELQPSGNRAAKPEWRIVIELLEKVDLVLLNRLLRRMIYYLFKRNVDEITEVLRLLEPSYSSGDPSDSLYTNVPNPKVDIQSLRHFTHEIFQIAEEHLPQEEITRQIHSWMAQERSRFLAIAVENINISLMDIRETIERFINIPRGESYLSPDEFINIRVALIRRFFSNNLKYINVAKHYIKVIDFYEILAKTAGPGKGSGKLGGKSSGLILASRILEAEKTKNPDLGNVRIPRSWYITSDTIMDFIHINALEEVISVKYLESHEVRAGYSYLQQLFKHSFFPPDIINQLDSILTDIGDNPIIVRSSSLLEDSFEAAFSGKYKSLFLSNTGPRSERVSRLLDAIAEIFASTFGPDPIEYRKERGLLDFQEEMGILIQEVVGTRVGKYFAPTYAGVAFSRNEFRWSPRIERCDGMVRMVMGLGTRAVDRVGDDYTFLASPGKPGLKVNIKYEDVIKYSQSKIDVLNLESNQFETLPIAKFLADFAMEFPGVEKVVSIDRQGNLVPPVGTLLNVEKNDLVVTFQNLTDNSRFFPQIHAILNLLESALESPVDVEFASDGKHLYILQCRPQSQVRVHAEVPLPRDVPADRLLFRATRFISPGSLPQLQYIVYVDPAGYAGLSSAEAMKQTAKTVSRLNRLLPRRSFILIGPGRWGSRGDIRLGVPVSYSDINNTAMISELAVVKDGYVPELSFGTHFFQDLVEADIKYLPLYPHEPDNAFNFELFASAPNHLTRLISEAAELENVIRVIHCEDLVPGSVFTVAMDSEQSVAVGFISGK
ncbi:MAG: PEP/pyruvate-binding domain-containing protein [Acidobacteriota bacterium]|jgi:hypothetical protein|nr:PEP/pyruvate-binding domain-containing protein [Acidobacteriota bacterium]